MSADAPTKIVSAPPSLPHGVEERPVAPGDELGGYQLLIRLGHGGMASVFLARKVGAAGFEKLAAIKVIHPHLASEPDFVEMFLDEARIAARLHDPHVVQIVDLGEADGQYFMVLEYVEGDTVAALLSALGETGEALPIDVALQVAADAAAGLSAAHELCDEQGRNLRLVHRDVSPQNLLVSTGGWVKVMDFGIAKAAGRRILTRTGQLRGKVPYMSPEQARGDPLDGRTDLFALGAVLWEMLTGRRLFEGKTEAAVLEKVLACEVTIPDDIPEDVGRILQRALTKDRDGRYGSAREMLADLQAALRRHTSKVDPRTRLADLVRRHLGEKIAYVRTQAAAASDRFPAPPHTSGSRRLRAPGPTTGPRTLDERWKRFGWVVPLAGAAAAAVLLATGVIEPGSKDAGPPASPPVAPAGPEVEGPAPAPATAAGHVQITVNTDPQGAVVVVGGRRVKRRTPVTIDLPRGRDPVTVELALEGHLPRTVQVVPATPATYDFVLQPLVPPTAAEQPLAPPAAAEKALKRTRPNGSRHRRVPGRPEGGSRKEAPSAADAAAVAEPSLAPMPDFERLVRSPEKEAKPEEKKSP